MYKMTICSSGKAIRNTSMAGFILIMQLLTFTLQAQTLSRHRSLTPLEFKESLKGPILSFPTAFTKTYEIDYQGMAKVIDRALDHGCRIVTLTSGNNRYDRLSYREVKDLTKFLVKTVGDRGVTIAATGNWSEDTVIDYVRYAEAVGASAVQVNPPKDANEDIAKAVKYYKDIANNTSLGIVLHGYYSVDLLKQLVKIKSIVALKEDVKDLSYYIDRQIVFGDRLAIFSGGDDARYLYGYAYGSPAYFSILYTYAPEIAQKFWEAIQKKDLKTAVSIVSKYDVPFIKQFTPAFWCAALEYLGGSQRYIRPKKGDPSKFKTLTGEELTDMKEFLCKIGLKSPECKYCAVVDTGTSLPLNWERGGHAGGNVNGSIIVAGGNNWNSDKTAKHWLKNSAVFKAGQWVQGPDLPMPLAYTMFSSDSSGLYIAGGTSNGKSLSPHVYRLILQKKDNTWQWKSLPKLPIAVSSGSGTILNGKFYVACGKTDKGMTNSMWVLDLYHIQRGWRECRPVPGAERTFPSLAACGGYLYLLGGLGSTSPLTPLKDAYRYDPEKNQWIRLRDLPLEGYAWVSQPVDDSHLILTGRAYGQIDKGIWIIDLNNMSMKKIGDDVSPATTAPLIPVANKQWWLVGGEPDANKNRTGRVSVITLK